jgi:hypothetical protein
MILPKGVYNYGGQYHVGGEDVLDDVFTLDGCAMVRLT